MKKIIYYSTLVTSITLMMALASCDKMIDIKPEKVLLAEDALKTPEDMQKLLNSCYDAMANQFNGSVQTYNDLLSDDLAKPLRDDLGFKTEIWTRNTNFFNSDVGGLYGRLYIPIYRVNTLDLFYDQIPGLSEADKQRIEAEGKFIRAMCHFELVKLWAQPYGFTASNTHPGIVIRSKASKDPLGRSTVGEVYSFIVNELNLAITNLPETNSFYANKNAARALLAKVYFQMNQFQNALTLLNEVIDNGGYSLSSTLNRFDNAAAQSEYIFSFISTNASTDNRGGEFIGKYRSDNKIPEYVMDKTLYTLMAQDTTDKRFKLLTIVNKDKDNEYVAVNKFNRDYLGAPYLHLTDMLLMRAEALGELNKDINVAAADLNQIINRAYSDPSGKTVSPGSSSTTIISKAREQRRYEMFCEGDRVQQLKRIGAKGEPNIRIRNAPWNCPGLALQFPSAEKTSLFVFNPTGGCN